MDSTYKVNKARFPFLVFGRSDYSGQFHPIALAVMNEHERTDDIEWFLQLLKQLCLKELELDVEPLSSMVFTISQIMI